MADKLSEIKFTIQPAPEPNAGQSDGNSCCCIPQPLEAEWSGGVLQTPAGPVCRVSTELTRKDLWGRFKCRVSSFRDSYTVPPGLYAVGEPGIGPDGGSDIFVSANYKFSFDMLRRELHGMNAWILALDTKGINVWCAAGKGTFGTDELIKRIGAASLAKAAGRGRLILPQLGAPGVNATGVRRATGFRLSYGPVRAKDIPAYIRAGYKADRDMREMKFGVLDRLALSPMEIIPAMKRYPLFALITLLIFGLAPQGIIFKDAISGGLPFLLYGLISVLAGAFLVPVFLPFIPFRSFAVKGWITGAAAFVITARTFAFFAYSGPIGPNILFWADLVFFPMASSYTALQFTGSTTFTCISGVKKELKAALPVYIASAAAAVVLLAIYKLLVWRLL